MAKHPKRKSLLLLLNIICQSPSVARAINKQAQSGIWCNWFLKFYKHSHTRIDSWIFSVITNNRQSQRPPPKVNLTHRDLNFNFHPAVIFCFFFSRIVLAIHSLVILTLRKFDRQQALVNEFKKSNANVNCSGPNRLQRLASTEPRLTIQRW